MKAQVIRFPSERLCSPYVGLTPEQRFILAQLRRQEPERPGISAGTLWWCAVAMFGWAAFLAVWVLR